MGRFGFVGGCWGLGVAGLRCDDFERGELRAEGFLAFFGYGVLKKVIGGGLVGMEFVGDY